MSEKNEHPMRAVPSVDALLQQFGDLLNRWGHDQVTVAIRRELADIRERISAGESPELSSEAIRARIAMELARTNESSLRPVINLSGTVLHTNLGRASLPIEALNAIVATAGEPSNLEFDLAGGTRGDRDSHVEALICELTGAEAATVVNNNAAAVLLVLNTLALGREVPVSRGELVEIGGSFRIPEVMQRANCTLVEVGATNRTHLKDFDNAIGEHTALLMKVHASNYRVEGFTHEVEDAELAELAHRHDLPMVNDLGSGCLVDFARYGLPAEPTAAEAIASGADLITFSGDKLLGGPQAGLIAGRRELVNQVNKNPLKRALRLDKMTLAALEEVLKLYRDPDTLAQRLPTLRQLTRSPADIAQQAERLAPSLQAALGTLYQVETAECFSQIGSGALPIETLPSMALVISAADGEDATLRQLAAGLRSLARPVIGRIHKGSLRLDLRCLDHEPAFIEQLPQLQAALL